MLPSCDGTVSYGVHRGGLSPMRFWCNRQRPSCVARAWNDEERPVTNRCGLCLGGYSCPLSSRQPRPDSCYGGDGFKRIGVL